MIELWKLFIYSGSFPLVRYMARRYFLLLCGCNLVLLSVLIDTLFLCLMQSYKSIFYFFGCSLVVMSKKSSHIPVSGRFSYVTLLGVLLVLVVLSKGPISLFFGKYYFCQHNFLKKLFCLIEQSLLSYCRSIDHYIQDLSTGLSNTGSNHFTLSSW